MRSQSFKKANTDLIWQKTSYANQVRNGEQSSFLERLLPLPWELWPSEARILLSLIIFWSIAGLFILGSASWWVATKEMGDGTYFLKKQLLWLFTGWSFAWLVISINLRKWLRISKICLLMCLILVGATVFFGTTINGSSRWLIIGSIQIQPSELIKPFVILQAANLFAQWKRIANSQKIIWLTLFGVLLFLILLQPNLSTASLIGILLWMIALSSGIKFRYLLSSAFLGISLGLVSIQKYEHQMRRVTSFINPWKDQHDSGYQLIQSLLAIGSGGMFGEGYGLSTQKLLYLPFISTDFIFSVFAEEFGFIGSLMLIFFLGLVAFIGLRVSLRCTNNYSKLIAIGCTLLLVGQSIMHLAVASGSMPTTGLPLPMVSYGGNSLLSSLIIGGLLIRCSLESTGVIGGLKIKKKLS